MFILLLEVNRNPKTNDALPFPYHRWSPHLAVQDKGQNCQVHQDGQRREAQEAPRQAGRKEPRCFSLRWRTACLQRTSYIGSDSPCHCSVCQLRQSFPTINKIKK